MRKALLYVRVSSKEQEQEGYSLDAQEKLGLDYASRNNLKIVKKWKVSESAWKEYRNAFNQMIEYAKRHSEIKNIIFDITDRMTRNDFDKLKIYTLIKEHDKSIHFSRTNKIFDSNSGSDEIFMFDIEVAVAKKMSNDISRKTKMGLLEKAEQGLYPSVAPIGYTNNRLTGLIEVDEEKSSYIEKAFDLMANQSYSTKSISDKLFKEGFRSVSNKKVGKSAIHHILKNPIYCGNFRWKEKTYQGSHSPIVSKELFDRVQSKLSGKGHPFPNKKNFAFNNLIKCGTCSCRVSGEQKKHKYNYYHCTFSKGRHSGKTYFTEAEIAVMFEPAIQGIQINMELAAWLKKALRESNKTQRTLQENRLNALRGQYNKLETRISRLYDMKLDGEINDNIFKAKEDEYQLQLLEMKAQMEQKKINPNAYDDACQIFELCNQLYPLYLKADLEEKSKLIRIIASNFTLNDVTLYPIYKKPFSILAKGLHRSNWLLG